MECHYRCVWQVIAALRKEFENLVLPLGIPGVGFKHQRQWSETIAAPIRKGRI